MAHRYPEVYQSKEEEQLQIFQNIIPNATIETLNVFNHCMKTDAIYKCALPYGLTSAIISYMFTYKKLGNKSFWMAGVSGLVMYCFSKVAYAPICCRKAVKLTNVDDPLNDQRKRIFRGLDKQETKNQNLVPNENLTEEQGVDWNNFDTDLDITSYEFNDMNDNVQEELTEESSASPKEKTEKKRVTYDELWMQHRRQRINDHYAKLNDFGSIYKMSVNGEVKQPSKKEELSIPETKVEEKNIWD